MPEELIIVQSVGVLGILTFRPFGINTNARTKENYFFKSITINFTTNTS